MPQTRKSRAPRAHTPVAQLRTYGVDGRELLACGPARRPCKSLRESSRSGAQGRTRSRRVWRHRPRCMASYLYGTRLLQLRLESRSQRSRSLRCAPGLLIQHLLQALVLFHARTRRRKVTLLPRAGGEQPPRRPAFPFGVVGARRRSCVFVRRTCISCASEANFADATVEASSYVVEATACASLASTSAREDSSSAALDTFAFAPHTTSRQRRPRLQWLPCGATAVRI